MACTPDPRSGREDPRREEITAQAELAEQTTTGGGQRVGPQLTELEDDLQAGAVTIHRHEPC